MRYSAGPPTLTPPSRRADGRRRCPRDSSLESTVGCLVRNRWDTPLGSEAYFLPERNAVLIRPLGCAPLSPVCTRPGSRQNRGQETVSDRGKRPAQERYARRSASRSSLVFRRSSRPSHAMTAARLLPCWARRASRRSAVKSLRGHVAAVAARHRRERVRLVQRARLGYASGLCGRGLVRSVSHRQ
jgi:hypothetical protein